ncbi:MAG TPA: phosphoribosylaminoimidazolesuccinocarboxamide synthase [Thermoanaerobaculia bacterium]|nr:phosphoribosylaminoimidazolesuccinocarboxamide synthase [Thermoanaerobaculia bacterium]
MNDIITETSLPFPLRARGKVRDVYEVGDDLLFVATDRVSAFDVVLGAGIPSKGTLLTRISDFWFDKFSDIENHRVESDFDQMPAEVRNFEFLRGRTMLVRRCEVIPVECVARGYLAGSGLKEYQQTGSVCGIELPRGLRAATRLPEPIFTPATKEASGHDQNIAFEQMAEIVGRSLAATLRTMTLDIYRRAEEYAAGRGIIIADTKFEFGILEDRVIWIDEALTPDSSRFWPAAEYSEGSSPPSFDKQFIRDWLESTSWDKTPPAPELPDVIVDRTRAKYIQAYEWLTGKAFE